MVKIAICKPQRPDRNGGVGWIDEAVTATVKDAPTVLADLLRKKLASEEFTDAATIHLSVEGSAPLAAGFQVKRAS